LQARLKPRVEPLTRLDFKGRFLALPANIRHGQK
jgi:hypothetical protein